MLTEYLCLLRIAFSLPDVTTDKEQLCHCHKECSFTIFRILVRMVEKFFLRLNIKIFLKIQFLLLLLCHNFTLLIARDLLTQFKFNHLNIVFVLLSGEVLQHEIVHRDATLCHQYNVTDEEEFVSH